MKDSGDRTVVAMIK